MIVGYARTSTIEQEAGFEAQLKQLNAAGCEKVFSEQVSAVAATREQLEAALDFVREGDSFIVTKLDRLARSVPHLCEIGAKLEAKGVSLKVLDQAIDTSTPTGRLMFNLLGSIAQFERELPRADAGWHRPRPEQTANTRAVLLLRGQRPTRCASSVTLA
jgi:DNA invertase Pin-like site-specific DNA recombinase